MKTYKEQYREAIAELEELKSQQTHTQQVCDKYHSLYEEKFNRVLELAQEKHELEQSQTQLAIQELEKIINIFEPYENDNRDTILKLNNNVSFIDYIEQRIKELRGK